MREVAPCNKYHECLTRSCNGCYLNDNSYRLPLGFGHWHSVSFAIIGAVITYIAISLGSPLFFVFSVQTGIIIACLLKCELYYDNMKYDNFFNEIKADPTAVIIIATVCFVLFVYIAMGVCIDVNINEEHHKTNILFVDKKLMNVSWENGPGTCQLFTYQGDVDTTKRYPIIIVKTNENFYKYKWVTISLGFYDVHKISDEVTYGWPLTFYRITFYWLDLFKRTNDERCYLIR